MSQVTVKHIFKEHTNKNIIIVIYTIHSLDTIVQFKS